MTEFAELSATTVRALAGRPDVRLQGGRLHEGRRPLPVLFPVAGTRRGAADGTALLLLHSDPAVYLELRPPDPLAGSVFQLLEQFRVESLATLPGVVRNLRDRHERWSLATFHAGAAESARGLLLYTVVQVCRARICGQPVVEATEDAIEATRAGLAPRIGADLLGLRRHRADQRLFARHARSLAEAVADLLDAPDPQQEATGDDRTALLLPESEGDGGRAPAAGRSVGAATDGYQVFTTAFDRQHDVGTLLRAELLARHRASLSELIAERRVPVNRLVRELTALFAFPVADGWDGAQESGRLDGRMLARLITTPTERRLFRIERTAPAVDVLVTFLVDCSGSMKSRRTDVAILVDVFARALELAGGDTEVLGFTTGAWHGGRARRDWQRAGRPPRPGRLNERCHLVFKPAGVTWRRSRRQIAGLLATELFREGIDGEAVEWAATRACSWPARRRLLVVLGDGSPMDRATALVNGDDLLDQHLRDVVADLERDGSVEVYGLGIDADVSGHYRRHARLDTLPGHGFQPFLDLLDLIGQARP